MLVTLTDKGRAMQREAVAIRMAIGQATGCSLEALQALTGDLQRLTEQLEAAPARDDAA